MENEDPVRVIAISFFFDSSNKYISQAPNLYTLPSSINTKRFPGKHTTTFGTIGRAPIINAHHLETPDPAKHNPRTEGEFKKTYTAMDVTEAGLQDRDIKQVRGRRTRLREGAERAPCFEREKVAVGPGRYEPFKRTPFAASTSFNKKEKAGSLGFGRTKRMGMTEFLASRGQIPDSPGMVYNPNRSDITNTLASTNKYHEFVKACRENALQPSKSASAALEASAGDSKALLSLAKATSSAAASKSFTKSMKSNAGFTSKKFGTAEKLERCLGGELTGPGPGRYEVKTMFHHKHKNVKHGTFGTAKRTDFLESMHIYGMVGSAEDVGVGDYDIDSGTFVNTTQNARCGYKPMSVLAQTRMKPHQYDHPSIYQSDSDMQTIMHVMHMAEPGHEDESAYESTSTAERKHREEGEAKGKKEKDDHPEIEVAGTMRFMSRPQPMMKMDKGKMVIDEIPPSPHRSMVATFTMGAKLKTIAKKNRAKKLREQKKTATLTVKSPAANQVATTAAPKSALQMAGSSVITSSSSSTSISVVEPEESSYNDDFEADADPQEASAQDEGYGDDFEDADSPKKADADLYDDSQFEDDEEE
jgi:hypothetical protein